MIITDPFSVQAQLDIISPEQIGTSIGVIVSIGVHEIWRFLTLVALSAAEINLLLVEDNPNDILLMRRAFTKAGFQCRVHVCRDGEEALTYLAGDGQYSDRESYPLPELVLLDLKLPRKSGFDVLEWLRSAPGLRRTPVLILSSSRERVDVNRAYDLGANSFLVKPTAFDALLGIVGQIQQYWLSINELPDRGE